MNDRIETLRRSRFEFAAVDDEQPPCVCGHAYEEHGDATGGDTGCGSFTRRDGFCRCEAYVPLDAQEAYERAYDAAGEKWERSRDE